MSSSDRKWSFRLRDILDAISRIEQYTVGLDEAELAANSMAVDAVIRNFQVIGEAPRHVPEDVQSANQHLPWSHMQKMRHVLVHDYDRTDITVLWNTQSRSGIEVNRA